MLQLDNTIDINKGMTQSNPTRTKVVRFFQTSTTIVGFPLSIVVLVLINLFYNSALDRTQAVVVSSINTRVASNVNQFFNAKTQLSHDMLYAVKHSKTIDFSQDFFGFADVAAPLFHADSDFLALYMASSDRQTMKFSAENVGSYLIEHRDYRSETDQQARKCSIPDTETPMRECTWGEWFEKSYDPYQKGWWQTANETAVGMTSSHEVPVVWAGPKWQTALAEGDTDKPVFELLFHISWNNGDGDSLYSNYKAKFLVDVLSNELADIDTGNEGLVIVTDELGTVIASPTGDIRKIITDQNTGEETVTFKTFEDYHEFSGKITAAQLAQDSNTIQVGDFAIVSSTLEQIGWKVLLTIKPNEFLEEATRLQRLAAGFSIGSIILVCIRVVFLMQSVYRKYTSQTATMVVPIQKADRYMDEVETPKSKEFTPEQILTSGQ